MKSPETDWIKVFAKPLYTLYRVWTYVCILVNYQFVPFGCALTKTKENF